jgi:hypothetical protein
MNWFRSNIRHGSRLALLALAVQFVLSFGHFHGSAAQAAPALQSAAPIDASSTDLLAAFDSASDAAQQPFPANHNSDQHPNDSCAICAVIALANAVLFASPPLLQLPQAIEFLYLTTDAEFVHLNQAGVAFQPRAPPIS